VSLEIEDPPLTRSSLDVQSSGDHVLEGISTGCLWILGPLQEWELTRHHRKGRLYETLIVEVPETLS
jgi:hypothetical protein